ncbi:hypothetical protein Saa2_06068 [Streptomyces acidiscabies]|nr:hypothetical protein Saa2_06068 [Streptomyces acidiscabies]
MKISARRSGREGGRRGSRVGCQLKGLAGAGVGAGWGRCAGRGRGVGGVRVRCRRPQPGGGRRELFGQPSVYAPPHAARLSQLTLLIGGLPGRHRITLRDRCCGARAHVVGRGPRSPVWRWFPTGTSRQRAPGVLLVALRSPRNGTGFPAGVRVNSRRAPFLWRVAGQHPTHGAPFLHGEGCSGLCCAHPTPHLSAGTAGVAEHHSAPGDAPSLGHRSAHHRPRAPGPHPATHGVAPRPGWAPTGRRQAPLHPTADATPGTTASAARRQALLRLTADATPSATQSWPPGPHFTSAQPRPPAPFTP